MSVQIRFPLSIGKTQMIDAYYDEMKYETSKSYLFGDSHTKEFDVWVPKKLIDSGDIEMKKHSNGYELWFPQWFAKENGLI